MRIVHCQREKYTHYIGRPKSGEPIKFGNPYPVTVYNTRARAVIRFEEYARGNKHLLELIRRLPEDAILGCWCDPLPCHGEIIIKLWKEMHEKA